MAEVLWPLKLLYARALRAIVNHAPTGEYCLRFFLQEEFDCHVINILSNHKDIFSVIRQKYGQTSGKVRVRTDIGQ